MTWKEDLTIKYMAVCFLGLACMIVSFFAGFWAMEKSYGGEVLVLIGIGFAIMLSFGTYGYIKNMEEGS